MLRLMRAARDEAMGDPYDLLVIGAGTAAIASSMRVRAAGWRIAVVDSAEQARRSVWSYGSSRCA